MDFPFSGFGVVAKDPVVEGRRPQLTILAFVAEARWFLLRKCRKTKILCILRDPNCVLFFQRSGVEDLGTGGRLDISWFTRWRVCVERG